MKRWLNFEFSSLFKRYEKLGFSIVLTAQNYYGRGRDGYCMHKTIELPH